MLDSVIKHTRAQRRRGALATLTISLSTGGAGCDTQIALGGVVEVTDVSLPMAESVSSISYKRERTCKSSVLDGICAALSAGVECGWRYAHQGPDPALLLAGLPSRAVLGLDRPRSHRRTAISDLGGYSMWKREVDG